MQWADLHSCWIFWHFAKENCQKTSLCYWRNWATVSHNVFISSPIPILEEEIDSFDRLIALKTLLTSACLTHGIHFGNFFWNNSDCLKPDSKSKYHWLQTDQCQRASCSQNTTYSYTHFCLKRTSTLYSQKLVIPRHNSSCLKYNCNHSGE